MALTKEQFKRLTRQGWEHRKRQKNKFVAPKTADQALPASELIPAGLYGASLVEVQHYDSTWGERIGFVFLITEGEHTGKKVTLTTATNLNRMSKLGQTLRGLLARELTDNEIRSGFDPHSLTGTECRVLVDERTTRCGTPYATVDRILR